MDYAKKKVFSFNAPSCSISLEIPLYILFFLSLKKLSKLGLKLAIFYVILFLIIYKFTQNLAVITKEVILDVEFAGIAKSPWGSTSAGFSATTSFNRKDFGLTWNQALETGGVLVGEKINLRGKPNTDHWWLKYKTNITKNSM